MHPRIGADVLQPIFRALHHREEMVDEMGRRKRCCTMMEKGGKIQENEKEQKIYDELGQK